MNGGRHRGPWTEEDNRGCLRAFMVGVAVGLVMVASTVGLTYWYTKTHCKAGETYELGSGCGVYEKVPMTTHKFVPRSGQ